MGVIMNNESKVIFDNLSKKDTEELLSIIKQNDKIQYTQEAFTIIHQILKDRGADVSEINNEPSVKYFHMNEGGLKNNKIEVSVTDIEMPFWSMVTFMVKWAFAAIPAILIIITYLSIIIFILGFLFGSLGSPIRSVFK